ncbi:MAG: hypothetical protein ACK5IH_00805, partial [Betaproteobacteria bacterium]
RRAAAPQPRQHAPRLPLRAHNDAPRWPGNPGQREPRNDNELIINRGSELNVARGQFWMSLDKLCIRLEQNGFFWSGADAFLRSVFTEVTDRVHV